MSNRQRAAARPKPKPTPRATGPGSDEDFVYDSSEGQITVPSLARVKAGVMRKARHLDEAGQMFAVLEAVCDQATLDIVDELEGKELNAFMEAWLEHSGVSLGE